MEVLNLPQIYADRLRNDGGGDLVIKPGVYDGPPFNAALSTPGFGQRHHGTPYIPVCRIRFEGVSYARNASGVYRVDGNEALGTMLGANVVLSANGLVLENFHFEPRVTSNPGRCGGIVMGHKSGFINCSASFFTRVGGFGLGASSPPGSNANEFFIKGGRASRNYDGYKVDVGGELNVGVMESLDATGNDHDGYVESGFLGNLYLSCHAANNGNLNDVAVNRILRKNRRNELLRQGMTLAQAAVIVDQELPILAPFGANYRVENLANYSTFVACYTEGDQQCLSRSQQITILGGNLVQQMQLADSSWNPIKNAGVLRFGWRSRGRFEQDGLFAQVPSISGTHRALAEHRYIRDDNEEPREFRTSELVGQGSTEQQAAAQALAELPSTEEAEPHLAFVRYGSANPTWLRDTIALDLVQPPGNSWCTPLAWTGERHEFGPGYLGVTRPMYSTPFFFDDDRTVIVPAGATVSVQFDDARLVEPAPPHRLRLFAPTVMTAAGGPRVTNSQWERVDSNSVAVRLSNAGPGDATATVVIQARQTR